MANGWTFERRQKQSEMIRNWQPWKMSTGAKTFEGKGVSKMNAFKHGGYKSDAILILSQVKEFLNHR